MSKIHMFPRAIRPAPPPLGLYLRPGRNDHRELGNLIASGHAACFGAVFQPTLVTRHRELREQVLAHNLDAILDPMTQQSALPGSFTDQLGALPWGVGRPHCTADFIGPKADEIVAALGDFALSHSFTEMIAPSHLLRSADDEWLEIDVRVANSLRKRLDQTGGSRIPLIYSLAISYAAFRDREERHRLVDALEGLPIDAVWLKIDGVGATSTANAARNYIEGSRDFHELGIPVVADHMGGMFGLSLMAFGAVSGISHGITLGERFDASAWRKPRQGSGFSPPHRVYFGSVDLMLSREQAEILLTRNVRGRAHFGCRDSSCCPRGTQDLLENPARHFLIQRIGEVSVLGQIPKGVRPQQFLDQYLRPATDRALAASNIDWEEEIMAKKTKDNRKRLDSLRVALGHLATRERPRSFAELPATRAAREAHL